MFLGRQRRMRSAKCFVQFSAANHRTASLSGFRSALLRVAPFSLLLVFVACGTTLPVTHRPASELRLEIIIGDQFSEKPNVSVSVHFHDETNQREVALADNTRVTCNGTDISANAKTIPIIRPNPIFVLGFCARQPPGGSYKIAYTDEQGRPRRRLCLCRLAHSPSSPHLQARRSPSRLMTPLLCASHCQLHHQAGARASTTSC